MTHTVSVMTSALAALMACCPFTLATKETMEVTQSGKTFTVDWYDDGRSNPYKVRFTKNSVSSVYTFDSSGRLKKLKAGSGKYKFNWESITSDVTVKSGAESMTLNAGSRMLGIDIQEKNVMHEVDAETTSLGHRRLYECDDCEETWETLCDNGIYTVCFWVPYLETLGFFWSSDAKASMKTMCTKFGNACDALPPSDACNGWCTDGELVPCRFPRASVVAERAMFARPCTIAVH